MAHVTVQAWEVECRRTDVTGWFGSSSEFYLTGAVLAGGGSGPWRQNNVFLTQPRTIDNGQRFNPDLVMFDGEVPLQKPADGQPETGFVRVAIAAYDKDSGGGWQKHREAIDSAQGMLDGKIKDGTIPISNDWKDKEGSNENAQLVINTIINGVQAVEEMDKDDLLGTFAEDIGINDIYAYDNTLYRDWHFWGFASDYVVRLGITTRRPPTEKELRQGG
jgi:hypothetical protein